MNRRILKTVTYCIIGILFFLEVYGVSLFIRHLIGGLSPSTEYKIRELRLKGLYNTIESTHTPDLHALYREGRIQGYQLMLPTKSDSENLDDVDDSSSNFDRFCDYYITVFEGEKWCLYEKKSNITNNYRLSINSNGIVSHTGSVPKL